MYCFKSGLVCGIAGKITLNTLNFRKKSSHFIPVYHPSLIYPGPPATNCQDTPGHTPGQCELGLNIAMYDENHLDKFSLQYIGPSVLICQL